MNETLRWMVGSGWGALALLGFSAGCAVDPVGVKTEEVVGECTKTSECKQMYSGATDCKNSAGGVCYCGGSVCVNGEPEPPVGQTPQPPSPDGPLNQCTSTADCEAAYPDHAVSHCNVGNGVCRCHAEGGGKARCYDQSAGVPPDPGPTPTPGAFRVAVSADGNQHDADDWHASPMILALLHRAGLTNQLVHFDYNNHLGSSSASMASTHKSHINTLAGQLGYSQSVLFDDQANLSGAVANLASAVNASSANNRLILICAGPMEVCWRGLDAANASKEQYVTVISHSNWNDNHQDTPQMSHTWSSIKNDFDVLAHHINDQNPPAFKSTCGEWNWLKQIPNYGTSLYSTMCTGSKAGDGSDAGMAWYVIKKNGQITGTSGSMSPTMAQVKSFFGQ